MRLHEVVITFILIAPLAVTLIVLAINLLGAGIKDLIKFLEIEEKENKILPDGPSPEGEVDKYIQKLKKERDLERERSI
jgi:hypothetical protein